jgi:parallel beta-helix repeat protein
MRRPARALAAALLLSFAIPAMAATLYVNVNNRTPASPFTSWAKAATTIQDAVDWATAGDNILVTNGVYQTGVRTVSGMRNRVAVTTRVRIQSVNGPEATTIRGYGPVGPAAVRCVYLTNGAVLSGFTLTDGATQTTGSNYRQYSGGGVLCESLSEVVSNCVLSGNSASYYGGGACNGTLNNCTLAGNSALYGGGASSNRLSNCTLTGNLAFAGAGVYHSMLNNCIAYYNSAPVGGNYDASTLNYCCTTPLPATGTGNLSVEPQLASLSHLGSGSPCRAGGSTTYAAGVDLDGEPWARPPSIGCDEYWSGSVTGVLSVALVVSYTNVAVGFAVDFEALIGGRVSASRWDFGDGVVVSNRPWASHAWEAEGDYPVELWAYNESNSGGVAASVKVHVAAQPVHYVALSSPAPLPPYSSWATAATNIQDAVDAASLPGALVWVTNGVYQTGGRDVYGMSNRVAVTMAVRVESVNGPEVTCILGSQVPDTTNGPAAVRCAYLTNGAVLVGFTLTNGATQSDGDKYKQCSGGGVWCESLSGVVSNCVVGGNSAWRYGGGAYCGTLNNCTLIGNWADLIGQGGGAYSGTLNNCALIGNWADTGGAASSNTLNNCALIANSAWYGGGAYSGILNNCSLTGNSAIGSGGGAYSGTLNNCTLTGNSAQEGGGAYFGTLASCSLISNSASRYGGGAAGGTLYNCTLANNSAFYGGGAASNTLNNCTLANNSALYGGGAASNTLNNCTLIGNSASYDGGGAYYATLNNCTLATNSASRYGGGAFRGTLTNCTLTGNWAVSGGGASSNTLNNCTLTGNSASGSGGGASNGRLNNCALTANSASSGGGASESTLFNCTLTGNSAFAGGGIYLSTLYNCIAYYNSAASGWNYTRSTLNYCCTTPLPAAGTGNLPVEPELASVSHLSAGSPCRGVGSAAYATGVDLDGELWARPPSIGCDEYWSGSVTGALSTALVVSYTNVAIGFAVDFEALIGGRVSASRWDFGDGVVVSNRPWASHAWLAEGDYVVELRAYNESNPGGVAASATVHVAAQPVHYVALSSPAPLSPYSSWATAATNIQDAVDAATLAGALVWVTNGVYQTGGRDVYGISNRVAVTMALRVESVNGPEVTTIWGGWPGIGPVRCVYLTNGAVLAGFTLTNGATQSDGDNYKQCSGGGVWCESLSGIVSNCMIGGNHARVCGGGAYSGTLINCTLAANSAMDGGGAYFNALNNCTLTGNSASSVGGGSYLCALNNCALTGNRASDSGGGAFYGTLNHCTLTANWAQAEGAGAYFAWLDNCTLTGNSTPGYGGGATFGTLNNCLLIGNSALCGGGVYLASLYNCTLARNSADNFGQGGGAYLGTLNNCILYYNTAPSGANSSGATLNYCCTTNPLFVDYPHGNLRLQSNSPCINAGSYASVTGSTDIDGRPRIVGAAVDLGAYEFQPGISGRFLGWLQSYGLLTDGSADYVDTDYDGLNNWQEWVAATDPTNSLSALRLLSPSITSTNTAVSWQSTAGLHYFLERSTNLASPFTLLATNIIGQPITTTYTDSEATSLAPLFYRVGVSSQ